MTKIDYESMTDAEFYIECADAVRVMSLRLVSITSTMAAIFRTATEEDQKGAPALLEFGMYGIMNSLGQVLSNMDAMVDGDEWMNPLFDELRRRYPDRPNSADSIVPVGDSQ